MDRAAQRASDLAWLRTAKVGDEVAVTNTYLSGENPFSHMVNNFNGANTRMMYGDRKDIVGVAREFCTITKIRAIIADGYVVDNNVYDSNGVQQTEMPVESESMIEDGWELERNLADECGNCGYPRENRYKARKQVQFGELCEPTDKLRKLAAKLKFNEEVKELNFRNFSDEKVHELITAINKEFHAQIDAGKSVNVLWE